jgi:Flp pilus assembly protein TadG
VEKKMKGQIDLHGQATAFKRGSNRAAKSRELRGGPGSLVRRVRALVRTGDEGSALVEIALVMPMLLAVITAICAFAVAFNNQLTLTSAVGSGAQYLQLIRTTTSNPCADTLTAIENAAPNLTPGSINLSFNFNGTTVASNSCAGDQSYLVQGQSVTVSATYPCALPIMPMGYGTKFVSSCQLAAKVTEYEY